MTKLLARSFCAALLALGVACGGAAGFSPRFPDNNAAELDSIAARALQSPRRRANMAVAIGPCRPENRGCYELVAYDLAARRVAWTSIAASTRGGPFIAGNFVVTHEDARWVARRLENGSIAVAAPTDGLSVVGAGGDGQQAVVVLSSGGTTVATSQIIGFDAGGVQWMKQLEVAVGVPAVRGGFTFVPWGAQNVSALDASTGEEVARLRSASDVFGHALSTDAGIVIGQSALLKFGSGAIQPATADRFAFATDELPGRPTLLRDAYVTPPAPENAMHRLRLGFGAGSNGAGVADGVVYYAFHAVVFALEVDTQRVRWAVLTPGDVAGLDGETGGVYITDRRGVITWADARTGATLEAGNFGRAVLHSVVDAAAASSTPGEAAPLTQSLIAIVEHRDTRLLPARVFAARMLSRTTDPTATTGLQALCGEPRLPTEVREAACEGLADRDDGGEAIIAELERHTGYLEQTSAPPVSALARAAVRRSERRAVSGLVAHLRDPHTRAADLKPIVDALTALGDRSAVPPIADFVRLYHVEAQQDPELTAAVVAGVELLRSIGGPASRPLIEEIIADRATPSDVRTTATATIERMDADAAAEQANAEAAAVEEAAMDFDRPPLFLTDSDIRHAFESVHGDLDRCVREAPGNPATSRIVLLADAEGRVRLVSVAPTALTPCLEPLVEAQRMPITRSGRPQIIIYVVRR